MKEKCPCSISMYCWTHYTHTHTCVRAHTLQNILVIYPLSCADVFVELESPVIAGVTFIQEACKTRKNVLDQVLTYCLNILYTPEDSRSPRLKDGALHTIGSIATVLLRVSNVK